MESKLLNLNRDYEGGGGGGGGGGEGFIDRSKVRILLCDNDVKSSEEVFKLLLKCSYQVTSVKSARQVIDALNAEGPDIDIILSEVDLPMAKGFKMLKYITRDNDLRRIPVIMMSAKDEVSIVVKCLRLGAADYLVKPLRTNELLNLWTHMWRRRRMLGLVEKSLLNYDLDLLSDPSDANTNSTTLITDETDDKSHRNTNPDMGMSAHQDDEFAAAAAVESRVINVLDCRPDFPVGDCQTGQFSPGPRKSELKIGQSSAFFTYVKSNTMKTKSQAVADIEVNDAAQDLRADAEHQECGNHYDDVPVHENGEAWESNSLVNDLPSSNSAPDSLSMERSCTPRASMEIQHETNYKEERLSEVHGHPRNEPHHDVSGLPAQAAYPYCMPGVMNQIMMSSTQVYQKSIHDIQTHGTTPMMPHYNHLPQCPPHVTGMASYPYYPVSICLQSGQMQSTNQSWPSFGSSTSTEVKPNKVDRREAALLKFRQKRKERCFDKKIRYVNRKKLAERRPRVRGQFVRKLNGVNVDLNGQPSADYDKDEEVEEELESRDSSAEGGGSGLI